MTIIAHIYLAMWNQQNNIYNLNTSIVVRMVGTYIMPISQNQNT